MEDNISWHNLSDDDVLSFDRGDSTFRVGRFKRILNDTLGNRAAVGPALLKKLQEKGIYRQQEHDYYNNRAWFEEGVDCEIMTTNKPGWKKAKFRLKIAIEVWSEEPETSEPESPLDDLRQKLSDES